MPKTASLGIEFFRHCMKPLLNVLPGCLLPCGWRCLCCCVPSFRLALLAAGASVGPLRPERSKDRQGRPPILERSRKDRVFDCVEPDLPRLAPRTGECGIALGPSIHGCSRQACAPGRTPYAQPAFERGDELGLAIDLAGTPAWRRAAVGPEIDNPDIPWARTREGISIRRIAWFVRIGVAVQRLSGIATVAPGLPLARRRAYRKPDLLSRGFVAEPQPHAIVGDTSSSACTALRASARSAKCTAPQLSASRFSS